MALGATPRWLWKKSKKAIPVTSTMTVPGTFWKPVVGGMPMRDSSAVRADSNEEAYCEEHAPEHSEEGISASIVVEGFAGSARMRWKSRSLSFLDGDELCADGESLDFERREAGVRRKRGRGRLGSEPGNGGGLWSEVDAGDARVGESLDEPALSAAVNAAGDVVVDLRAKRWTLALLILAVKKEAGHYGEERKGDQAALLA